MGRLKHDVGAPQMFEGVFMKNQLLEDPRVEAWKGEYPRQWWAFQQLKSNDELRERVLVAVLKGNQEALSINELVTFAEAIEVHRRTAKAGTVKPPPAVGERRSFPIIVTRMTRMRSGASIFFRVDFSSPNGWGGFFDTTNPGVVEKISKIRNHGQPLTVVGEVSRRPYEFYVELDGGVGIV